MDIPNIVGMLACISCINICIYIYTFMYMHMHVDMYNANPIHTHTYIYRHAYIRVHCVHTGINNRSATCSSHQSLAHSFVEEP